MAAPPYGRRAADAPPVPALRIGGRLSGRPPDPSNGGFQMQSITRAANTRRHLSRHERQRQARAEAFSRRTPAGPATPPPVKLESNDLALIDHLVRQDRTAVSSALLAIAGIGGGRRSPEGGAGVCRRDGSLGSGRGRDQPEPGSADRPARRSWHSAMSTKGWPRERGAASSCRVGSTACGPPATAARNRQVDRMPYRTVDRRLGRARRRLRAVRRSEAKVG